MPQPRRRPQPVSVRPPLSPARWGVPAILIAVAAVYWRALDFQFVWDDRMQIAANSSITSWHYLPQYFTSHVWGFTQNWTSYYRPVFLVVLRVTFALFGLDTRGWHLIPIVLHAANIILAYFVVRKLTSDSLTSVIAVGLFALHPVVIEAVGWISGMTDPLMLLWLLSSFLCYLRWRESARVGWLVGAVVLFVLALLTKESAVVFPVMLAVYELVNADRFRAEHSSSGTWQWTVLLIMVAEVLLYLAIRQAVLGTMVGMTAAAVPWSTVLFTAPSTVLRFLRFLILPYGMSPFYDSAYVTNPGWRFVLPLLAFLLLGTALWWWARRTKSPVILFCAVWALLGVAPVLNIRVMQEGDFVHLRFLYVPCLALSVVAAIGIRQLFAKARHGLAISAMVMAVLGSATAAQIGYWQSNETAYRRGIEIAPDNRVPKNNLADDYIKAGRFDEAQALLDDVLKQHPDFWMANYNVGYIAYRRGDWPKVAEYMQRSIDNHGEEVDAYAYRSFALLKLGRPEEAEKTIRQAIALKPSARQYHFVLGLVLRQEQRWPEALAAFQEELKINPGDKGAARHVGDLQARVSRPSSRN